MDSDAPSGFPPWYACRTGGNRDAARKTEEQKKLGMKATIPWPAAAFAAGATVWLAVGLAGATPRARIAVVLDDPEGAQLVTGALEMRVQEAGYQVVAAETSERIRKVVAPRELLRTRLPEGLSVFEADAILAGRVAYGAPTEIEGIRSVQVAVSVRLINLATGAATATLQATGVGIGVGGPTLVMRAARQAVTQLFERHGLTEALARVGQSAGSVVLIVQHVPHRRAWLELQESLRAALAGAPVTEVYYAKGLGKLILGGSRSEKAMAGPDIANLIGTDRAVALRVVEVANTRIVARYDRARTVRVHALVLEPRLPRPDRKKATELGKFVATQLASFEFARASYQRGPLSRQAALRRAREIGANVVVESEVLGQGGSAALALRVLHVETGRPIHRQQRVLAGADGKFGAAEALVATLETALPEKLAGDRSPPPAVHGTIPTAEMDR